MIILLLGKGGFFLYKDTTLFVTVCVWCVYRCVCVFACAFSYMCIHVGIHLCCMFGTYLVKMAYISETQL